MYSKLILKDRPEIVWALDDINQSSSLSMPLNFYAVAASAYAASINTSVTDVINTPMIFGGGTSLRLSSSSTPNISIPLLDRFSEIYGSRQSCLEFWLKVDSVPSNEIKIVTKRNNPNIGLYLKENYLMFRYGTSSSYMEVAYGLGELSDPTHIVLNHNSAGIEIIVNGISTIENNEDSITLPIDASHSSNNFFDFYGNQDSGIHVDCISLYSFNVRSNTAKSHYVFGLGKNIDENVFFSLGGDFYNLSTENTRKSFYAVWDDPEEWTLTTYDNLISTDLGIRPEIYDVPEFFSFDNKVDTSGNKISFTSSAGVTSGTYIDVNKLQTLTNSGMRPIFAEVELSGLLPLEGFPQTIMSYGKLPYSPIIDFNLVNISSSYYMVVINRNTTSSLSFPIASISSSPTIVVGMSNTNGGKFYYGTSGSALQIASFIGFSGSVYGVDEMSDIFPPIPESVIRIGSALTYDRTSDISLVGNAGQFTGKFISLSVLRENFSGSTFASVHGYASPVYSLIYDSKKSGFRNRSYGNANIVIHGNTLAGPLDSGSAVISGNRFEFGYPDVISGSQVSIHATLLDYSGSIVYPRTKLSKVNSLGWINYIDLNNKYLSIDIDVLSEDSFDYPPFLKYMKAETYEYSGSYVEILDNGGDRIRINAAPTASGNIYIPEFELTPSIFLNKYSGARVFNNTIDIEFSPIGKNLDINQLGNLVVWYDARYPRGISAPPYDDGTASGATWRSISASPILATPPAASVNPEYRTQSLNILTVNQLNGSESASITRFTGNAASIQSSIDIASSGNRSIKVIPDGTSTDSYLDFGMYGYASSANRFVFNGQHYTFMGDISLLKTQNSDALDARARRLVMYFASTTSTGASFGLLGTASSTQAPNLVGTYTVSAVATVPSGTNWISVRFYNGSSVSGDPVYWDNMAIYSGSTISGSSTTFYQPLASFDDRPTYKFNGLDQYFTSAFVLNQPLTVYTVARAFGNGSPFVGFSGSAPALYTSGGNFRMRAGGPVELATGSTNYNFNIICGVFNSNSSSLFVNASAVSGNVGTGSYTSGIRIGFRQNPLTRLSGDISAVLVFSKAHNKTEVDLVMNSLKDIYNVQY